MRFVLTVFAVTLATFGIGYYLTVPANPEIRFWHEVEMRRDREISEARARQPKTPIIFFTGGSSTAFSIDPAFIEEHCGLPSFNLGLPVAAGGEYLVHQALRRTVPGDTLVICLEPDMLVYPTIDASPTRFSFAIATRDGRMMDAAGGSSFDTYPSLRDFLNFSRPGAGHMAVLAAKLATGKGYRYTEQDIRYHGRIETQVAGAQPTGPRLGTHLTPYGRQLLQSAKRAAAKRNVSLIYAFPWHHVFEEAVEETRSQRRKLLNEISDIVPTIDDGHLGAASNPAWFSDSPLHLSADGSRVRSQDLASALRVWLTSKSPPGR